MSAKRADSLPEIRLKTDKRNFHPWIYRKMLERPDPAAGARDGDAVRIYDKRGRFVGRGLYNGRSQIGLRVLDWAGEREPIDYRFFRERIGEAVRIRREALALEDATDAYRAVNSEGDRLSGLIVDVFAGRAVVEVMSLGIWKRRQWVEQALRDLYRLDGVHFRADERIQALEGFKAKPAATGPVEVEIRENGVRFVVDVEGGHKTGFFLDQRENRRALAQHAGGRRVLDICCYTGGFGIAARVLGGARDVTGVDLDEWAVAQAERNARLNGLRVGPEGVARFVHANAFHYLRDAVAAGQEWDVVVCDPSKLAPSREHLERALRDYADLNRLALRALRPDGVFMTCSCSGVVSVEDFLGVLARASGDARRELRVLRVTGPGPDHVVSADCPEGFYLKVVLAQALER